jgi:hypothetical protein
MTEVILSERKYTLEMVGETLREAGTLILVFTPMYELFESHTPAWPILCVELFFGVASLYAGIELERRRR